MVPINMNNIVEQLTTLIKEDNFTQFKKLISNSLLNSHHKELLYDIAFVEQKKEFYNLLETKVSLTNEKRTNIFLRLLERRQLIKDESIIDKLDDTVLMHRMSSIHFSVLIKNQSEKFLIDFCEKFPITTFINFKKLLFGSFKNDKSQLAHYLTDKQLEKDNIFYCAICASHFNNRELLIEVLLKGMKNNPDLLDEMKSLKNKFLTAKYKIINGKFVKDESQKEEFEGFINEAVIEAFTLKLDEELNKKDSVLLNIQKKKLKI